MSYVLGGILLGRAVLGRVGKPGGFPHIVQCLDIQSTLLDGKVSHTSDARAGTTTIRAVTP